MKFFRRAINAALLLAQALLLGFCVWIGLESSRPAPGHPRTVLVEIEKGKGVKAIAETLKKQGVLPKVAPFIWRYRLFYGRKSLKSGEYEMTAPSTPLAVIDLLMKGQVYLRTVTVAEGLTGVETFAVFLGAGFGSAKGFQAAFRVTAPLGLLDPAAVDLEGYLFPESYRLPKGISSAEITKKMVEQFKTVFAEDWRKRAAALGLSARQAVTLASLIEKETGRPEEKPLVSAVFHNRLRQGMKLDCDPTIIYALKLRGAYEGRLRGKDLREDSPYNTYLHPGLPPGPICNPGRASLEAVLHPADVDFLFFVSRNDGSHQFSRTFREHALAVAKYQR